MVMTITTIGYGEVNTATMAERLVAIICMSGESLDREPCTL